MEAGIQIGDQIIKIAETDTKDLILEDAVSLLRGEPGTDIEVTIRRGESMEFTVVLTRELIEFGITVKTRTCDEKSSCDKIILRVIVGLMEISINRFLHRTYFLFCYNLL